MGRRLGRRSASDDRGTGAIIPSPTLASASPVCSPSDSGNRRASGPIDPSHPAAKPAPGPGLPSPDRLLPAQTWHRDERTYRGPHRIVRQAAGMNLPDRSQNWHVVRCSGTPLLAGACLNIVLLVPRRPRARSSPDVPVKAIEHASTFTGRSGLERDPHTMRGVGRGSTTSGRCRETSNLGMQRCVGTRE
jgi:hypothetical protein